MKASFRAPIAAAALLALAAATPAHAADSGVKAGVLSCHASSGWGFVFGSSRTLNCEYSAGPQTSERYTGSIMKFGVDIGYLSSAVIVWAVLAPTSTVAPGTLAGNYAGATGSAAVGFGAGANVLLGGSGNHVVLQPVSIEGQTGLNVAGGIAALELKSVGAQ
ncbi:MAG TPA: DUF992 domain-containing protein [Alphaproteobacteria bacterium]|nr:DUF992 domain-containing protein [Alphaproteobacteria bacterium]